jgi:putative aminopeptidase FrvX
MLRSESWEFLRRLLETPSVSGYEQPVQEVIRERMARYSDELRTDLHGNVIAVRQPTGTPRVMLAGHCDQIGLMVQHIDDNGYLFFNTIGGFDVMVLIGQRVQVWTKSGPLLGVIARKPIHLMNEEDRRKPPEIHDLWIDIGAKKKKEAAAQVEIGDPVTLALGVQEVQNNLIVSPGLDDKIGSWVVMEALRLLERRQFQAGVYAVSTVQEELGLRGARTSAFGIEPTVGIAVDVTHATDYPGVDPKRTGEVKIGEGPVISRGPNINPVVFKLLVETAKKKRIPHQICGDPRPTGTDANAIQINRAGVATGLVSVPNRYMHSPVEVVSRTDLENCARLLAEFIVALTPETDFTP